MIGRLSSILYSHRFSQVYLLVKISFPGQLSLILHSYWFKLISHFTYRIHAILDQYYQLHKDDEFCFYNVGEVRYLRSAVINKMRRLLKMKKLPVEFFDSSPEEYLNVMT